MSYISKELLAHPIVLASIGVSILIAAGSGWYYTTASRPPVTTVNTTNSTPNVITASGSVEPSQNPNLSFVVGGRVARVAVGVGDMVSRGEVLASLDTSILAAQRLGAQATLKTQQARLSALEAPPRDVDLSIKQTALAQAQTTLSNAYAAAATSIGSAYDTAFSGTAAYTDSLFITPSSQVSPGLAFETRDSTAQHSAENQRIAVNGELGVWHAEEITISTMSTAQIDQELTVSLAHLSVFRSYADAVLLALSTAISNGAFSTSVIAANQASVGVYRDAINAQIAALQATQKTLAADKLSVQSSQDALNQLNAGATTQDIAAGEAQVELAQANLANIDAQIGQAQVVAPYSGTVGSVQVKVGDTVAGGTTAVTLNPASALQIVAYVSESDAGRIAAGAAADVTLDAYGAGRHFAATVVSVDRSPTVQQGGVPAYKVTLQFNQDDSAVSSGMTANVSISI